MATDPPAWALVIGASRGLGLAIAADLASARGWQVLATVRGDTAPTALASIPGVTPVTGVDVATDDGERALAAALAGKRVGVLIFNAAVMRKETDLAAFDGGAAQAMLATNAVGFVRAVRAAEPCLSAGSKVLLISSQMSSIARTAAGPPEGAMLGYKMSKAAANVAAASLAARLRPRGVGVGVIHPGAIATDMYAYYHSHGGDDRAAAALTALAHRGGPTPPADAARAVVDAALAVSAEGEFVFRTVEGGDGVLPW